MVSLIPSFEYLLNRICVQEIRVCSSALFRYSDCMDVFFGVMMSIMVLFSIRYNSLLIQIDTSWSLQTLSDQCKLHYVSKAELNERLKQKEYEVLSYCSDGKSSSLLQQVYNLLIQIDTSWLLQSLLNVSKAKLNERLKIMGFSMKGCRYGIYKMTWILLRKKFQSLIIF